jgi:hypothetical protein
MAEDIKFIFEKYKEVLKEAFEEPADPRRAFNRFVDRGNYGGSGGKRFGGDVSLAGTGLTRKNQEFAEKERFWDREKRESKIQLSLQHDYFTDLEALAEDTDPENQENISALFSELDQVGHNSLQFEEHYLVFDFELSNRIANLDEQIRLMLQSPSAKKGARYIKEKLINKMLDIPVWYFRIRDSGMDIPEGPANAITILRVTKWCEKPENKHYNMPMEVLEDGSMRAKVSYTGYKGHDGGEEIQANIMPSGDSEGEMKDFERRGIEVDAPIGGNPETPYLPKRRTPEDLAPSLGNKESELDKARSEGDVIAQDRLSPKNTFSNPERERLETPKKRRIKPNPKKKVLTTPELATPEPAPKKKTVKKPATKKPATKKEEPKEEKPKKTPTKKKKPVKESYQRFIRVIPF